MLFSGEWEERYWFSTSIFSFLLNFFGHFSHWSLPRHLKKARELYIYRNVPSKRLTPSACSKLFYKVGIKTNGVVMADFLSFRLSLVFSYRTFLRYPSFSIEFAQNCHSNFYNVLILSKAIF